MTTTAEPEPFAPPDALDEASAHLPPASPTPLWRRIDRLVMVVFAIGISIPAVVMLIGLRPAPIENRPLLTPPPASAEALLDPEFFGALDDFLADNVILKPLAVELKAEVDTKLGATSNPEVIPGVGDWLFTRSELILKCTYTADDIAAMLDETAAAFMAAGQDFRFIAIPDKHAIYPDRLPTDVDLPTPCSDERRAAMRNALAERSAWAIDGWGPLLAARAADPTGVRLYHAQDTHWAPAGASHAIKALVGTIEPAVWSDAEVVQTGTKDAPQDLARQLGLTRTEKTPQYRMRSGVDIDRRAMDIPVKLTNARAVYRITATGDGPFIGGRTVFIYDSFFGRVMAQVAPFFGESVWVHMNDLKEHPELASAIRPADRVILARVERGLYTTDISTLLSPLVGAR